MNTTTTTSVVSFDSIGDACQKLAKAEEGFFPKLVAYVASLPADADVKAELKTAEQAYEKAKGFKVGSYGAYRSAKSVICKALEHGVSILDDKGKPKGKTAIEKELAELASTEGADAKSAYDKCMVALATFRACYDRIETPEEVKLLAVELANLLKDVSSDMPKSKA